MKQTKIIAKILYTGSRVLAIGYAITTFYALFCILTGIWTGLPDEKKLHIFYPFTTEPFLMAENNMLYLIFSFLLPLLLYSMFFWLASNVFRVFREPTLFTPQNIVHLRRFYRFNLITPALATAVGSCFVPVEDFIIALIVVHSFLGVFTYFLAAIFNQGIGLQNERDLFI
ncbi:DUF2975 domain-containing protein [Chitinophaga sp. XS-30]|uniref:DUF2975 domain-containing protein n=1 Tax=Chitinophaga sp. XS-30 TaxID=2604421 RepID=UPI0011DD0C84|nr:DUF2975 domain-containing protein [Chitinophaga sp. XS-30]QEH42447.1 DUF2975 domain-containing protein [Chitinophaga sp. XS-30]